MPVVTNRVSHSNIKTKTRSFPNLQRVRVSVNGTNQRAYVCTRCLRTGLAAKPKVSKYVAPADKAEASA